MYYRGFKIVFSEKNKKYSISIRNSLNKMVAIESKNLCFIKSKIDDVIDYQVFICSYPCNDKKTSTFWGGIK